MPNNDRWPELPYAAWKDTLETLHLWTQIVGKIRLGLAPWLNHSWHVTLYVTARGLTTSPMPWRGGSVQIDFDFNDHVLRIQTAKGERREIALKPMATADFYQAVMEALNALGIEAKINTVPSEIPDGIPFERDRLHKSYDPEYAHRFWRVLLSAHEVLTHFFWGSFDLAVTRFSGRRAPLHPGGVPHLPNAVAQEAYSHEVSSAGFWPGGGGPVDYAAFYSYAYPAPEGFASAAGRPQEAFFAKDLGEFLLPYDAVRAASDPDRALMEFLQSTYEAAADLAKWDRAALECALGVPGKARAV